MNDVDKSPMCRDCGKTMLPAQVCESFGPSHYLRTRLGWKCIECGNEISEAILQRIERWKHLESLISECCEIVPDLGAAMKCELESIETCLAEEGIRVEAC